MEQQMAYFDRSPHIASTHKTGVSLHSQTLHSRESAVPLGRCFEASAIAQMFVRRAHKRYGENPLHEDLSRMWWTPPLTPRQALDLEASQIVGKLGLEPIASLSDHDSIAAPMQLQVLNRGGSVPVAVEWTVPFRETYSHVGVHNMDPRSAMASMGEMAWFTAGPESEDLPEMLAAFDSYPGCLVVLNYPYWDQPTIGSDLQRSPRGFHAQFPALDPRAGDPRPSRLEGEPAHRGSLAAVRGTACLRRRPARSRAQCRSQRDLRLYIRRVRPRSAFGSKPGGADAAVQATLGLAHHRELRRHRERCPGPRIGLDAVDGTRLSSLRRRRSPIASRDVRHEASRRAPGGDVRVPRVEPPLCQTGARMGDAANQGAGVSSARLRSSFVGATAGRLLAGHLSRGERRRSHRAPVDRVCR